MTDIIKCPICLKGQLEEKEKFYRCNHFKTIDDKCDFTIWKTISGKEITDKIVRELSENKKTGFLDGFVSKEGKPFSAPLIINESNTISFGKDIEVPNVECVNCNGKIIETAYYFKCENTFDNSCQISIPKVVASKALSQEQINTLLAGRTTSFINNFMAKNGNPFSAKLFIDENDFQVKFDSSVASCPKCKTGNIRAFEKAYSCSNYKAEESCNFSIWKSQYGGEVSVDNVIKLCDESKTQEITFSTKEGNHPYKGFLVLNEDFSITMEKSTK